ncbi:MAG: hypothetical protein AABZ80_05635 [Gemmatimonadota bacterium]
MFVDLIEALRCPRPHDESQLVVAAGRVVDRHIMEGTLGCPVCGAEFKIVAGITQFEMPGRPTPAQEPDAELGLRIAAFLELTDAKGFAILCGTWGAQLDPIQRVADTPLLLVNPPTHYGGEPAGVVLCDAVPLAASCARAAALDHDMAATQMASVVRAVRQGGRLIGPAALSLPAGVTEVARDETLWVGEKPGAVRFVELKKGGG